MSTTIDQRVVEMRFDNKQFESGVATTMSTLDKFKQKLKFADASKGLEEVSAAAKKCDVSSVGEAAEKVGLKFNAMYSIADQALRNITNSAMFYGKRIISALTIDPVKTGFSEYETQINAVQTILANTESKGKTLDDVNGALDELNKYADKTIYNFTEMTRNIGTFTAAGVDLDTSVSAIKGIANLAAVSGSTSQQASTAMYQLSQAMASGTVKLMDWNSVVNAGMGGQVFQDALKETAKVHGVAIDDIIAKQGSFRESLSEGWLTTEILTDTLAKFTGDLSEEQLKAQGYTEQQIKDIMKLGQTANDAATKVKTFSQLFDTLKEAAQSGWTQTWEILVGDFEEAKALLTSVSDTIGAIIGKAAESRNELLENWKVLGGRQDLIDSFKNIFDGIVNIVKPIKEAFNEMFPPMTAERLKSFTEGLKSLTERLTLSDKGSENLKRTFKGLFAVLDISKTILGAVFKAIGSLFGSVEDLGGGILGVTAKFGDWLVAFSELIKSSGVFDKVFGGVTTVLKTVFKVIGKLCDSIFGVNDAASDMKDGVSSAFESLGSAIEGSTLYKVFSTLWKGMKAVVSVIAKLFSSLAGGLISKIGNVDFSGILDFIKTLSVGGIAIYIAKFVKGFSDIVGTVGSFKDSAIGILDSVRGCFEAYQTQLQAGALMKIATAIGILVASLVVLSFIDPDKMGTAIGAITTLFVELLTAMKVLGKMDKGKGAVKSAVAMTSMATALLILSAAMKVMSSMSWSEMGVGLTGMVTGLVALVAAVNLLPDKKVGSAARALAKLSTAVLILSLALKIMGTMSWEEMALSLVAMTAGLAALVGAVNLLPKDTALRTLGLTGLAAAMVILAAALKIMGTMSWTEMGKGLLTLATSLGVLVGAIRLLPKDTVLRVLGLVGVATAMVILAAALKIMGNMSWEEIGKGLSTIGGAMVILAVALNVMKNTLPGAAALVVATAALAVLAPVLATFGAMKTSTIIKGLTTIAATFAIFAAAGYLLKPVIPSILALSGAMALLGIGILAAGVGLMAFGAGLSALAVGFTSIAASIGVVVTGIVELVAAFIVGVLKGIGEGIVAFCKIIADGAPIIGEAIKEIILTLCDVLIECAPMIATTLLELLVSALATFTQYIPQIVEGLFNFLIALLDALAENIPRLIQATMKLIGAFFQGVLDALGSVDTDTLIKGIIAVGLLAGLVAALAAITPLIPSALVGVVGMGVVVGELALVLAAIGAFATIPGLDWLINKGGNLLESIGTAIGKFIGGLAGGITQGFTNSLPDIATDLSDFMTKLKPFIEGARMLDASALSGVKTLVEVIIALTAANLVESITSFVTGKSSISEFATQLPQLGKGMKEFSDSVAGISTEAITAAANAAKALAQMTQYIPKEGGMKAWFSGDTSISNFADKLPTLGAGLKGFSDSVAGVNPENITAAASAAKTLAKMTEDFPNDTDKMDSFGDSLKTFGSNLSKYFKKIQDIDETTINASNRAVSSIIDLSTINAGDLNGVASGLDKVVAALKNLSKVPKNSAASFAKALRDLAKTSTDAFVKEFESIDDDMKKAGQKAIEAFVEGVNSREIKVTTACTDITSDGTDAILDTRKSFESAGMSLIQGFINGIQSKNSSVVSAVRAMAAAAVTAVKNALNINSPSRVFRDIGYGIPEGMALGIDKFSGLVNESAVAMADGSIDGVKKSIAHIADVINGNVDSQPTIRPVLDLSDLKSGARSIGGLFGSGVSIGATANIGAISAAMGRRNQNGTTNDVVSAINKLSKEMGGSRGDTYNFGSISYDDNSSISAAVRELVRAAKVERRV